MIALTKYDGSKIILNAEKIQSVENTPDTVITLTSGLKLIVKEKAEEVAKAFKAYKKEIFRKTQGDLP